LIKGKEIVDTPLTEKDIRDLEFSLKHNIEYIALSMVRTGDDIKILKEKIEEFGGDPWILAKIENPSGVENISEIAGEADGVIVARGDLGQYYPLERIPSLQQSITYEGNRRGKITVIATQILESMRRNERPTRAEVTDVFKSVEEKVDAIMLTGETAIGRYPVEAVEWASKILEEADTRFNEETIFYNRDFEETLFDKFARGAIYMSHLLEGKIIGYTKRGNTARRLARYRPKSMVYMVTQNEVVASKISLLYGVKAIYEEAGEDYHDILERALSKLRKEGVIKEGDIVIFTVGVRPESTDMLRIEVA
jgi:pyruvate kinase